MFRWPSFVAQNPADYAETGPFFSLKHHLNGPMVSEGIIYGPSGRVVSQFVAEMTGTWDEHSGELRETFRFASGQTDNRCWKISLLEGGAYTATAGDVVGTAQGMVSGNAAQSLYNLRLGPEARNAVVSAVDWMHLSENGTILNRSQFRKFGLKVGELIATIRPA